MKFLKQVSVSLMALAAATAANAATQPFVTPGSSTITVNMDSLGPLSGYNITAVGNATWHNATGTLSNPVQALTTSTNPGPLLVEYGNTSGLKFTQGMFGPSVTLQDFSFDLGTGTLYGDFIIRFTFGPLFDLQDQPLLVASHVVSSFGGEPGASVTTSTTPRGLDFSATDFTLSDPFKNQLLVMGIDPGQLGFMATMFKEVQVATTVPEPSAYALTMAGLLPLALFAARRRKQQD